jgi:hypothetical protein
MNQEGGSPSRHSDCSSRYEEIVLDEDCGEAGRQLNELRRNRQTRAGPL